MPSPIIYDSASGDRVSRQIRAADSAFASGAVQSGQVASGSIGSVHLADNAVASGDIAAGAVASGQIASGQVGSVHLASGTTVAPARVLGGAGESGAAEPISGTQPVAINASGNAVLANAISGRMPAIGIAGANTTSGATISLHHEGQFNSTLFRSGNMVGGRRMFVHLSGDFSTTPPTASGSFSQVMGVAKSASGGFFKPEMEILQVT